LLPCTNCGNNLEIFKGTIIQCFTCGHKNSHYESFEAFSLYVQEILGYSKAIEDIEKNIDEKELYRRLELVDLEYNKYLKEISSLDTFVISRLYNNNTKNLLTNAIKLSKNLGMLKILIEIYIIPHIKGKVLEDRYKEYCLICQIYHLAILGLRHTIESKDNFKVEFASEFYEKAKSNFENAIQICNKINNEYPDLNLEKERIVFQICFEFCSILKDILLLNPTIYSDQLELLIKRCDEIESFKLRYLKSEMNKIYEYSNSIPMLIEELRTQKPLMQIDAEQEHILYHSEEILEKLSTSKLWMRDLEENYLIFQNEILKIHCGVFLDYLKLYRDEFYKKIKDAREKFDKLIEKLVQTTLIEYTIIVSEYFDELERGFQFLDSQPLDIVNRSRLVKEDLVLLDSDVKSFIFSILDQVFNEEIKKKEIPTLISSISDKHSSFDKMIYQYMKKIIDNFISERDERRFTIEEQRSIFNSKLRPLIDNLISISFTLTSDQIPYPMFIEILMSNTQLELEREYKIYFLVENPSQIEIKDISVTFFVPQSFRISIRRYKIKKLKPSQKIRLETNIIPEKIGVYYFMAMLQYEYSYEMFWMPSIKQKIHVVEKIDSLFSSELKSELNEEELLDYIYKKYGKIEQIDSENIKIESLQENLKQISSLDILKKEAFSEKKKNDKNLLPEI